MVDTGLGRFGEGATHVAHQSTLASVPVDASHSGCDRVFRAGLSNISRTNLAVQGIGYALSDLLIQEHVSMLTDSGMYFFPGNHDESPPGPAARWMAHLQATEVLTKCCKSSGEMG